MLIFTETLPKQSFQRIALYRCRYLLSCQRKSKAGVYTALFSNQNRNTGVATPDIVLKYLLEIYRSR
jgi:hypothetical protein